MNGPKEKSKVSISAQYLPMREKKIENAYTFLEAETYGQQKYVT